MTDQERIIAEVERLTGRTFTPTRTQSIQLKNIVDPVEEILAALPHQVTDLQKEVSDPIEGLEPDDVSPGVIMGLMVLNRAMRGFSSNSEDFMLKDMDPKDIYQMGFAKGAKSAPKTLVEFAYKEILGREPDGPGWQHYQDMLDTGEMRHAVIRHIELSPEASGEG